jgi:Dolichyl-phosphate-mannose-protein mannosyltransferase
MWLLSMAQRPLTIAAELAVIAVIASVALGYGIRDAGLASGYVDPILRAGAQDEATYGHAAARMIRTGHWLTPVFLDRFLLNKPPLLMWAGAASMRLSGISPHALRLPVLLAGVLSCVLVYWWLRRSQPVAGAFPAVVLLLGTPLFHDMNRRFMTDGILTLLIVAAMFVLVSDPRLERHAAAVGFGVLSGAAILTKSAAGLLPLLILLVYWILAAGKERPIARRVLEAFAIAALVAAPWHIYEWVVHRDWFMAEYVRFQLLGSGVTAPSRYTQDSNFWFYGKELLHTDPVLLALWLTALPWIVMAWKRSNSTQARLLTAWCLTLALCLGAFGTRAAYYLLPLLPALALMSAQFSPLLRGRLAWLTGAALIVMFAVKVRAADPVWALDYRAKSVPSAKALNDYSLLRRTNELLIVSTDDEFYASVIDLPKVRYVYLTPLDPSKTSEFFYRLGMILPTGKFCALPSLLPAYEQQLRAWGLPAALHPEGTIISGNSASDLPELIDCSPDRDFLIPEELRTLTAQAASATHTISETSSGLILLLSRNSKRRVESSVAPGTLVTAR